MFFQSLPRHFAHAGHHFSRCGSDPIGRAYSIMARLERSGKPLYFKAPANPALAKKIASQEKGESKEASSVAEITVKQNLAPEPKKNIEGKVQSLKAEEPAVKVSAKASEDTIKSPGVSIKESLPMMEPASKPSTFDLPFPNISKFYTGPRFLLKIILGTRQIL